MPAGPVGGDFIQPPGETRAANPVPEPPGGWTNNPYRGTEMHGVRVDNEYYHAPDEWPDDSDTIVYEGPPGDVTPIPVRVITETAREMRQWRTGRFLIGSTPIVIIPRHERHAKVRVQNIDAAVNVVIGESVNTTPTSGWRISPNTFIEIDTEDAIYCVSEGIAVYVNVLIETRTEQPTHLSDPSASPRRR
jgi:hypothetical protein